MPHTRMRFITTKIEKKLKYTPVLAIQGARQTGKSFFVREILEKSFKNSLYLTFDQDSTKGFASRDIENFMIKYSDYRPLIIDEAQKVPKIFDAVKFSVDHKRIPGCFILLGSTEFSKLAMIRDSLTGRISRVRFYAMTIAEALQLKHIASKNAFYLSQRKEVNRKILLNHLDSGGLPGLFSIRSAEEKKMALKDWIDMTVFRDIHTFPAVKVNSEYCLKILRLVATTPFCTAGSIAKELRIDLRKVKLHLNVLETLFVLHRLEPHSLGTGKAIYFLLDVAIAAALGADFGKQLETLFVQQYLAKLSFELDDLGEIYYYRPARSKKFCFIEERSNFTSAIEIFPSPSLKKTDFYLLTALRNKKLKKKINLYALVSHASLPVIPHVEFKLWEAMA